MIRGLLAAGSKLVVEAATEGYVIKKEIVLSNEIDLETGKITTLNVNLSDEHITAAATGLSLPFTDDFSDLTGNGSAAKHLVPQRQKRKQLVCGELLCLSIQLPAWPTHEFERQLRVYRHQRTGSLRTVLGTDFGQSLAERILPGSK